jgi:hypothetical protein
MRKTIAGLLVLPTSLAAFGGELSARNGSVKLTWEDKTGSYQIIYRDPGWVFSGHLPSPGAPAEQSQGADALGGYRQVEFSWMDGALPMTGSMRVYEEKPLVLFSDTCAAPRQDPPAPFPDFSGLPSGLHVFSYQQQAFAPPAFKANECATPWLFFDDKSEALLVSPASHFLVASMFGDGHTRAASGYNLKLRNLPPGFSQQTILAFGQGINRTWDLWGQSLNTLRGAKRPANDADDLLKYFSYWTDNGATYYYNYDTNKGYAGTLQSLVAHYRQEEIPLHCLQLDSWWYSKTFADASGRIGTTKQPKLPAGEWNRYGGLLEYKAHPFLFPNGLAEFQKSVGLPLAAHNRWIDPSSPYHEKYRISGVAAVDPKWWDDIAGYLNSSGVVTYEQDWLDRIYTFSPEFSSTVDTGEIFLREMARACRGRGMTLQYCMPYPCYFMAGSQYDNLTTIRVSDDRFSQSRWNSFLYTSRLAASMGIWPWSDVFASSETNNFLLAALSGGPVGIGDPIGKEDKANIFKSVRADGVIVKPDAPCLPLDQCYITDAAKSGEPLLSATATDHDGLRTSYLLVFNRNRTEARTARFNPGELGYKGQVCVYESASGTATPLPSDQLFEITLPPNAARSYIVAPIGASGAAFFGDSGKFVATGKQRISRLKDEPGKLSATVLFAHSEKTIELRGYASMKPTVSVQNGTPDDERFDPATHLFTLDISVNQSSAVESASNPVRSALVVFTFGTPAGQSHRD